MNEVYRKSKIKKMCKFSFSAPRNPICTDANESKSSRKLERKLQIVVPTKTKDLLHENLFTH